MNDAYARGTDRLAVAVGVVAAGSAVCLATYLAVRGPFGTINDLGNATIGVLSAALAWRMRRYLPGRGGDLAVAAATVGAAITVAGSALVISRTTGFFLAGLVSSLGFAGIGAWLIALQRSEHAMVWPRALRTVGLSAGVLMTLGIIAVPAIILQLDDMERAPAWVWLAEVGWLGIYVLYPAWAIGVGLVEARQGGQTRSVERDGADEGAEVRSWTGG